MTYFLQLFVATSIMFPSIKKRIKNPKHCKLTELLISFSCVTFTYLAALLIPQLDNLISLVGAVCCSSLSLVFPPVIYLATFWSGDEKTNKLPIKKWEIVFNLCIVILGLFLCITGIYL